MRVRLRVTAIAIGVLLTLLFFHSPAEADSLSWSWSISTLTTVNFPNTIPVSGSGTLTTGPLTTIPPLPGGFNGLAYYVSSMSGQLSGQSVSLATPPDGYIPGQTNLFFFNPGGCTSSSCLFFGDGLYFSSGTNSLLWKLFRPDQGPNTQYVTLYGLSDKIGERPAQLDLVRTPEPSTLLLLGIGLLGLMGLTLLKNRLNWTRYLSKSPTPVS